MSQAHEDNLSQPEGQSPVVGEQTFKNDPATVITEHLAGVGELYLASVEAAAEIIRASHPRRDALGVSLDLNSKISNPTTVLAGLFATGHDALPSNWRANPEITRTVLSMCGQIEAGILRARQADEFYLGGSSYVDARLGEVEHFVEALQQK